MSEPQDRSPLRNETPSRRWSLPIGGGRKWTHLLTVAVVFGLICLPTFWRMASPSSQSDIYQHTQIAKALISNGQWISYSAFFPIAYLVTGAEATEFSTRVGVVLLLTLFVALKSLGILACSAILVRSWLSAWIITFFVMLGMSLPPSITTWKDIYLGQLNANVWHNSTTIAASAFVIPTFTAMVIFLRRRNSLAAVSGAAFLCLATCFKPSFALAFFPALIIVGCCVLKCARAPKSSWTTLALVGAPTSVVMLIQFCVTYVSTVNAFPKKIPVFSPFEVWSMYSSNIPSSLIVSLGGVALVTTILFFHKTERISLALAWVTLGVGVFLYIMVAERDSAGVPVFDGNWTWSVVPAMSCVFFAATVGLTRLLMNSAFDRRRRVWALVGLLTITPHVVIGLYYLLTIGTGFQPTYMMH